MTKPIDSARAFAKSRSADLPPAHEDRDWLTNIEYRRDNNVRLTRLRFEEWIGDAFLAGYVAGAGSPLFSGLAARAHRFARRFDVKASVAGEAALWAGFVGLSVYALATEGRDATTLAGICAVAALGVRATRPQREPRP